MYAGHGGSAHISLARELLGWEPKVELREGLKRTLNESGAQALIGTGSQ